MKCIARLLTLLTVSVVLSTTTACIATEANAPGVPGATRSPGAPDPSAIFEQARIADEGVVFTQGFDGPDANDVKMHQFWFGGLKAQPNKVDFLGITDEEAFSGKHSYKIVITFEPLAGKGGGAYFLLPVEIPAWSDLKLKWRIKTVVSPAAKVHPFHGFTGGDLEAGESHNVSPYMGLKTDETDGWETWEAKALKTGKVGERVEGMAIYF